MKRGEMWWVDLGQREGSAPAFRRPVVIISADSFNRSAIATVVVAALTTNLDLQRAPGNVLIKKRKGGLRHDSVANVSSLTTIDKRMLENLIGNLTREQLRELDAGLRQALAL